LDDSLIGAGQGERRREKMIVKGAEQDDATFKELID